MSTIIRKQVDLFDEKTLTKLGISTDAEKADLKAKIEEVIKAAGARKTRHSGGMKPAELYIVGSHDEIIVNTTTDNKISSINTTTVFDWSNTKDGQPVGFFWWKELVAPRVSQREETAGQFVGADGSANLVCREIDENFDLTNAEKAKATVDALKDKPLSCKATPFAWNKQGRDMFAYTLDFKA